MFASTVRRSSGVEPSFSVHRVVQQQQPYSRGHGHRASRPGCRVKPTSAERSLEVTAARKQVTHLLTHLVANQPTETVLHYITLPYVTVVT